MDNSTSTSTDNVWTDDMTENLIKLHIEARTEQANLQKLGVKQTIQNIWLQKWLSVYPNSKLKANQLRSKLRKVKNNLPKPKLNEDIKNFQKYVHISSTHSQKPIFDAICYSCGMLLYGFVSAGHKFTLDPKVRGEILQAPILTLYTNLGELSHISKRQTWYSCLICKNGPKNPFPCNNPETGIMERPQEILNLRNNYEKGMVAICGLFSTTMKQANPMKHQWEHRIGETNALTKLERHYYGMYGFLSSSDSNQNMPQEQSKLRITSALLWLKEHNAIYRSFYGHFETMFRFDKDLISVYATEAITDRKGNPVSDQLDQDPIAICFPFADEKSAPQIAQEDDIAGFQHPKKGVLSKTKYADKDLEAKTWPWLYPYGNGTFRPEGGMKIMNYIKMRLLNKDDRWRKDENWSFFFYDRIIKQRIIYANRARKVVVKNAPENLDVEAVRQIEGTKTNNPYEIYGTSVPNTIPGSKYYWTSRLLDLLAISKELGPPSFFITLTQNDGWPELQAHICTDTNATSPNVKRQSCINDSVPTIIAFQKRFELFKTHVMKNKDGPIGKVNDYWYRAEFQKRGAVHIHMAVWCEDIPHDAVSAEMPRTEDPENMSDMEYFRQLVRQFQQHATCCPNRCFKGHDGKLLDYCKYGFPFKIQNEESLDNSGIRILYQRHQEEDSRTVPYNLKMLALWQGHLNVQKVSKGGWELYLAKYIAKAEPTFDLHLPENTSNPERYLRTRIAGRLEVDYTLLGCQLSRGSRDVTFMPTEFEPKSAYLKRAIHLPPDKHSKDIYYDNVFQKYLDRPENLKDVLYTDFVRQFRYANGYNKQDNESDTEEEEPHPKNSKTCDAKGRNIVKRKPGKEAIPRYRYIVPSGDDQEHFYEQKLILNIPLTKRSAQTIISKENKSKTYTEECAIRGLLEKTEDSMQVLHFAENQGFKLDKIKDIAQRLVDCGWIDSEKVDVFLTGVMEKRPNTELESIKEVTDDAIQPDECDLGHLNLQAKRRNLDAMVAKFSSSQRKAFNWLTENLEKQQVFACIVGPAGSGKSFLLNAIVEACAHKLHIQKLATTGVAAFLIRGETLHHFLKMDIECNSYLEKGTSEYALVHNAELLIIDEFSMMEKAVLQKLDNMCRLIEASQNSKKPFGGKHILLVGDPAQLPAIEQDIFSSFIWQQFKILLLKEVKRQEDDNYLEILNSIRLGELTTVHKQILQQRLVPENSFNDLPTPIIVSLRKERDQWNTFFLQRHNGEEFTFHAKDTDGNGNAISTSDQQSIIRYHRERLPDVLILKIGAPVLLLKNINVADGWVNGTLAIVKDIRDSFIQIQHQTLQKTTVITRMKQNLAYKNSTAGIVREQFPLLLGWALTVHKVQGMTLETATVHLGPSFFASGQAYVALSRVKKLQDLHLTALSEKAIVLDPRYRDLLEWMNKVDILKEDGDDACISEYPIPMPSTSAVMKKTKKRPILEDCPTLPKKVSSESNQYLKNIQEQLKEKNQTHVSQNIEPITLCKLETRFSIPATNIQQNIHPVFLQHYEILYTPGQGNCMWNSISIGLTGNTSSMIRLRKLTADTLIKHKTRFEHIINTYSVAEETFDQIVHSATLDGAWGGEFHLQALAEGLKRPIFVYSSFKNTEGIFFFSTNEEVPLHLAFEHRLSGTGQHLVYWPFDINSRSRNALMCHFSQFHYSAIIRRSPESVIFQPYQNLFQMDEIEE